MRISNFKTKFLKPIKVLINAKYTFGLIQKSEIIIFDSNNRETNIDFFRDNQFKFKYLDTRFESFNFFVLLLTILKKGINSKYIDYLENFIIKSNPKIVLTFVDNDPRIYELKKKLPKIFFIVVQNGFRPISSIEFEDNTSLPCDYFLLFNSKEKEKFEKKINTTFIDNGSFISNNIEIVENKKDNSVIFISSWQPKNKTLNFSEFKSYNFSYEDWRFPDIFILKLLENFCFKNKLKLKILGKNISYEWKQEERNFYNSFLKNRWEHIVLDTKKLVYQCLDYSKMNVFIDSTLGYESLGRNTPTAAFTLRNSKIKVVPDYNFGWPNLDNVGPFWSNICDEKKCYEILNFLNSCSYSNWSGVRDNYSEYIPFHQPKNYKLLNKIKEIKEGKIF